MKNLLYSLFAVLALTCAFTACSDDNADEVINYSTTPEKASEGTYTGTWTRALLSDATVSQTYEGEVVLVATDSVGVTDVTFSCPDISLDATSVANVWNSGRGFQFVNNVFTNNAANSLGTAFAGRITEDNQLTTSFTISIREGRVLTEYNYSFVGNKQ